MAGNLVLITGATGHLGYRTLRFALEYGYTVRAVVRSEAKADKVRDSAALKAMKKDAKLSFVVIPDFLVPGAFDEAVRDVKYIIHVASPLATKVPNGADLDEWFVKPAVQGTVAVLESAKKAGTVQRIVITSSVASIMPLGALLQSVDATFSAESRLPDMQGPFAVSAASKIAAFNKSEAWVKAERPPFDVIHIHPTFVLGRDDLTDSVAYFQSNVNKFVVNQATGNVDPEFHSVPNNYNHVDDSARIHVLSLEPKVAGNQSFIVSNNGQDGMTWDDTNAIIAKRYPEEVKNGTFPNSGTYQTVIGKLDIKKTEETFGFKLANWEDCVTSVLDHYLEVLLEEQQGGK
ncbi:hypothetical protein LTR53_012632 [Teratosphaeriaceae sp. CCFEE 6253]|nr:hypothetical protein LTR53_012632 [Teratosphaeriaceae sp. CCFEE 6253]